MIGHPLPEESIDDSVRSTDGCMGLVLANPGLWIMECDGQWLMVRGWKSAPSPVSLEVPSGWNGAVYNTPWDGCIVIQRRTTACAIHGS